MAYRGLKEAKDWYDTMGRLTMHGDPPKKTFVEALEQVGGLLLEIKRRDIYVEKLEIEKKALRGIAKSVLGDSGIDEVVEAALKRG